MNKIEVGKVYPKALRNGVFLEYDKGFTLLMFLPNLTEKETESIESGKYRFALTEISDMLIFLYEFKNDIKLSDVPFHFGLYEDNRINDLPDIDDDSDGLGLNIVAVDSATGVVKAIRLIGLGTRFSKKLIEICKKQSEETVDPITHNHNVITLQNKYQAKDLMKFSSVICK